MDLLIAANTLLEFLVNRSQFISEVEYLSEMFESNSSARLYIAEPGLDKIASYLKLLNGLENSEKIVDAIKKRVKVLALTQVLAQEARFSCATNYESAVEVQLAIKAGIGAIVTHKPSDFSSEEFTIITLNKLEQRHKLEINYLKNNLPAILVISNLNKALYHLPSYIAPKLLKQKKNTHQLNPNYSSNKLSTLSGKNSSPLYIDQDLLLIKSFARSTAHVDIQSTGLITGCQAYINPVISLKESMLHAGKAYSSLVDGLSIKPLLAQSTTYADVVKLSNLGLESLTCKSSLDVLKTSIDRGLSIKSPIPQPIGQIESTRIRGLTATAPQPYENSLGGKLTNDILQMEKGLSAINSLSIKSPIPQPIGQIESTRIRGLTATVPQPYENSHNNLKASIDHSNKLNPLLKVDHSFSDRSGLLSQIKLLESMQRANPLDSYLSRKN